MKAVVRDGLGLEPSPSALWGRPFVDLHSLNLQDFCIPFELTVYSEIPEGFLQF